MICPHCYSSFITIVQFDNRKESVTGYRDAGEYFECRECSKVSTVEEVEDMDAQSCEQALIAACVLTRTAELIALQITMRMYEQAGLELRESLALCQQEARLEGRLGWVN